MLWVKCRKHFLRYLLIFNNLIEHYAIIVEL